MGKHEGNGGNQNNVQASEDRSGRSTGGSVRADMPLAAWSGQTGSDTFHVIFDGKVYKNEWWVGTEHCPGEAQSDPNNNPWRPERNATQQEMDTLGNPTRCSSEPPPLPGDELTGNDPATLKTYEKAGYKRDGTGTNLSYTSTRVAKPVYNHYTKDTSKPKVAAYITDWCQYDARLDAGWENQPVSTSGRGFDLVNIPETAYDRLIFSFLGVYGQTTGGIARSIEAHAKGAGIDKPGHVTAVDAWGDVGSYRNCGLGSGNYDTSPSNWIQYFTQGKAAGLLGGLRELKKKADGAGHPLELAFSIGGWSMSGYFSPMAADPVQRKVFIDSIIGIFNLFPMFSAVDIDWEYPGGGGLEDNPSSPEDGANFALLIRELRAEMNKLSNGDKKEITIAAACDVKKLEASNIPELLKAGVSNVYLMAYDFFGYAWAGSLAHHTNLKAAPGAAFSAEAAVDYLLGLGVPPGVLHMGYANYGRAAAEANPATGEHNMRGQPLGSFEAGAVEFFDSLFNHIDYTQSPPVGKHGFGLYTDPRADADYLYSETAKQFISLDTTRTVKAKAEFVAQRGLAGMFSWSADQDGGLLCNAAREGLGYALLPDGKTFDMAGTYKPGTSRPLGPDTKKKS